MQILTETRTYPSQGKGGRPTTMKVTYELELVNGMLTNVRNQSGFSIEKSSECFEYFSAKFQ